MDIHDTKPDSFFLKKPSPLMLLSDPMLDEKEIRVYVKRDDLLRSEEPSGNKWRKLKYNLLEAQAQKHDTLLTFGGAFSNNIHAVAAAGKAFGFKSIGVIRGEPSSILNPTLRFARDCGMQLHFVSRNIFRDQNTPHQIDSLHNQFGDFYLLPEGGTNGLALKGSAELVGEVREQLGYAPDYFCVSCGTGGTMAGIVSAQEDGQETIGIAALKGDFLGDEVRRLLLNDTLGLPNTNFTIQNNYHFGGYAKWTSQLIEFINEFKEKHGIVLDPIYTGKLLYGVWDLAEKNYFKRGATIVVVHTGGLQGILGFNERFENILK